MAPLTLWFGHLSQRISPEFCQTRVDGFLNLCGDSVSVVEEESPMYREPYRQKKPEHAVRFLGIGQQFLAVISLDRRRWPEHLERIRKECSPATIMFFSLEPTTQQIRIVQDFDEKLGQPEQIACPECNQAVYFAFGHCPYCGGGMDTRARVCTKCEDYRVYSPTYGYCPTCGNELARAPKGVDVRNCDHSDLLLGHPTTAELLDYGDVTDGEK